jgi:hypothetical protein
VEDPVAAYQQDNILEWHTVEEDNTGTEQSGVAEVAGTKHTGWLVLTLTLVLTLVLDRLNSLRESPWTSFAFAWTNWKVQKTDGWEWCQGMILLLLLHRVRLLHGVPLLRVRLPSRQRGGLTPEDGVDVGEEVRDSYDSLREVDLVVVVADVSCSRRRGVGFDDGETKISVWIQVRVMRFRLWLLQCMSDAEDDDD